MILLLYPCVPGSALGLVSMDEKGVKEYHLTLEDFFDGGSLDKAPPVQVNRRK